MTKKRRYSIGVLIGGVHTNFPKEIIKGVILASIELDVDVYFYLGTQTKGFFQDVIGVYSSNSYDYQFNSIHDYSLISGLDGLIISFGTLGKYLNNPDVKAFAEKFKSIPTVFLQERVERENCHFLISDNYQGICLVMEHLIEKHGCKKILYMDGPENNTDAAERKQAYLDMMEKYGLPVTPTMIERGDYSEFVDAEVERLLDNNPHADAIVFANDDMAASAYKVCARRSLTIGKDILLTGYDNSETATGLLPPLTTVAQDAIAMGREAVYDMIKRLRGKPVESKRIPVSFVQRESCGCLPVSMTETRSADLSLEIQKLTHTIAHMKQDAINFQRKSWVIPLLARDLNDCIDDEAEFCFQIMNKMKELHANSSYLFLLDPPIIYEGISDSICPDGLRLASYYRHGRAMSYQVNDRPLVTKENNISKIMDDGDRHKFMIFLLFSGERQYGLLACDIEQEDFSFFYVVSLQLGLSLRYLEISRQEAMHRHALSHDIEVIRDQNRVLDIMSNHDELTGLLNLRGFTEQAGVLRKQFASPHKAYMIYGDLDHLKEINDSWGHTEGNFALCSLADILRESLRSTDLIARIGGDEFLALVVSDQDAFDEVFRARIKNACETLNAQSEKPYYVEVSLGIVGFSFDQSTDIQKMVAEADKKLYESKKRRRPSIRKP